eukprot:4738293-Pyramimonas_sp.AAC.1
MRASMDPIGSLFGSGRVSWILFVCCADPTSCVCKKRWIHLFPGNNYIIIINIRDPGEIGSAEHRT